MMGQVERLAVLLYRAEFTPMAEDMSPTVVPARSYAQALEILKAGYRQVEVDAYYYSLKEKNAVN